MKEKAKSYNTTHKTARTEYNKGRNLEYFVIIFHVYKFCQIDEISIRSCIMAVTPFKHGATKN